MTTRTAFQQLSDELAEFHAPRLVAFLHDHPWSTMRELTFGTGISRPIARLILNRGDFVKRQSPHHKSAYVWANGGGA